MHFIEVQIEASPELAEMLLAELGEGGYESFTETPLGLNAYIPEGAFSEQLLQELAEKYRQQGGVSYQMQRVAQQNWNEIWEKSYPPIIVADRCRVRASFHPPAPEFEYEIVINPKMSFGTGHHETTHLMLAAQLDWDHTGKNVLDVGSGTGILAIMASLRGAKTVDGLDIEEWAVENAQENAVLNGCSNVTMQRGTLAEVFLTPPYELILANINRNVLLEEIPAYAERLTPTGTLLLSGFYESDAADLAYVAKNAGLDTVTQQTRHGWALLHLQKSF